MSSKLNTGAAIPLIGFGTAFTTASGPVGHEEMKSAVLAAIKEGYRHIDTAAFYGSEASVGKALTEAFDVGLLARDEIFVTSKLWCSDAYPEGVIPALRRTLSALRLQYLDLYLMHWPLRLKEGSNFFNPKDDDFLPVDIKGTWQAMERCVDLGLTKAIGVSNFSSKKIEDLLTYARIPPAVDQVEMHPTWQQKQLREYCSNVNVHVSAWSPLGASGKHWGSRVVLDHPLIKEIAAKHGKTSAQVALRWGLQQGVSVLPRSTTKAHMANNLQVFDWQLTQDDLDKINKLEQKKIMSGYQLCNDTSSPYKTVEELWDEKI
eukprot:c26612_g1_i1 orf=217-1173(+)